MLGFRNSHFWKNYVVCLLVVTLVFVMLYSGFIFGGKFYGYNDIGADTTEQYLPVFAFETNALKQGEDGQYNLQFGLGKYIQGLFWKYINPINLPLLLFGEEYLHIGILAATYVRYALICLFALLFFRRLFQDHIAASICSVLWTFSGFAVLWGQHYGFLLAMLYFTVAVYGFQLFLDEDRKRFLVIPCMAFLAGNSYYWLYITCFFLLIYGVLYLALKGKSFLQIAKKAGQFVLVMVPVFCISANYLLPAVAEFFSTTRTSVLNTSGVSDPLIYEPSVIIAFITRVLSANLIGTGDTFVGPFNYYETAILNISILFVFAEVYLLTSKYWKQTLGITIVCVLALCMPRVSRLLVFAPNTQRWSYLLCFAEVFAIGFALKDIFANRKEKRFTFVLWRAVILADILLAGIFYVLYRVNLYVGGWYLSTDICYLLAAMVAMYHIVFLFLRGDKVFYPLLIAAVAVELIACNYATLYDRETATLEDWYQDMYNDGTEEVVDWIQQQDDTLYRIGRTGSREYMAALMQDYNSLSCYHSLNASEYVNLVRSYGYQAGNFIRVDGTDFLANTMLGAKYVISEGDGYFNPDYYELIYDDGQFQVYKNRYWLGFGYVYPQQTEEYTDHSQTRLEKLWLLSDSYYLSDSVSISGHAVEGTKTLELLPYLTGQENCQVEQGEMLQITGTADNMRLYFAMPELDGNWIVSGAKVTMSAASASQMFLDSRSADYDWGACGKASVLYSAGEQVFYLENSTMDVPEELSLFCSYAMQDMTIESVELILVNEDTLRGNLQTLRDSGITDLTQKGNTFSSVADNPYSQDAMLCIPLLYSTNWEATVDGVEVQVQNINGGLVGIEIPSGEHDIELTYQNDVYVWGSVISAVSIAAYLIVILVLKKREKLY